MGGVLFFALAPCRRPTGLLLPLPFPVAGAKKKQHPGWCFFFGSGPVPAPNGASPSLAFGRSKKKHTPWVVFIFLLWPRAGAQRRFSFPCLSPGPEQKKNTLGFCSGPVPAPNGASPSPALPRGRSKKNTLAGCFFYILLWPRAGAQGRIKKKNTLGGVFFCSGPVPAPNEASPSPAFPRGRSKKKTPWVVFFFFALAPCRRPRPEQKKTPWVVLIFCSGPVPAPNEASPSPAFPRGRSKKKKNTHPGWCFFFCSGPVLAPNEASPSPAFPRGRSKKKTPWVVFFFLLWPRAGAQGRSKKKHLVFFFCSGPVPAPNGASPSPAFPGGRSQKKNTLGGVFFFALAPCRRPTELLLPLPSAAVKKNTHPGWCLFFCSGPVPAPNGASPSPAFLRGRSKKKTPWVFALAPCRRPTGLLLPLPFPGAGAKKNTLGVFFFNFALAPCRRPRPDQKKNTLGGVFFLLWPRAGAQRSFSFPCLSPGPEQKKNTLGGVFFLLWPRAGAQGRSKKNHPGWCLFFALAPCRRPTALLLPLPFPGAGAKKKKKHALGGVFFFALAPCRRPTKLLLPLPFPGAGAKKNHPGWCLFFCSGPVPAPKAGAKNNTLGGVFFLLWPRAGAQRSFSFPCLLPRGRSKKKNTLGGVFFFALALCRRPRPEQKNKTPWLVFFFLLWPRAGAQRGFSFPCLSPGPEQKKKNNTLGGVFFCSGPAEAPNGLLLPLPFPGAGEKKQHPGWCFFFCSGPVPAPKAGAKKKTPWVVFFFLLWPRAGAQRGFSFPCLSPGPEQKKNTLGGVFFLLWPRRGAQRSATKKKTLCTPGPTAKNFLETHDAGHEQKGATTKKKHPDLLYDNMPPKPILMTETPALCVYWKSDSYWRNRVTS